MGKKKNIQKLLSGTKEMKMCEIENVLLQFGYELDRIKGSHHIFAKPGCDIITVPSHRGKVKEIYLRELRKFIIHLLS